MPRIVDRKKHKDELLLKCFNYFAEKGFAGVTMRQIGTELGISTGSLYHYFPSKQNILEEMFIRVSRFEIILASSLVSEDKQLEEKLDSLTEFFYQREEFLRSFFLLTIDYHRHCKHEDSKKFMKEFADTVILAVSENVGIDLIHAKHLFTYFTGLFYQRLVFDESLDFDLLTSGFNKMITNNIKEGVSL